jgi:ADP-ribose pyrophosphatase YjhB (NUDIX family)
MNYLSNEDFVNVYGKVPRLCVDLVIKTEEGILLALRSSEPYKDMWNTIGGAVYKNEKIDEACRRIAMNETGLDVKVLGFLGFIEYPPEERSGVSVHSVSIMIEAEQISGELKPNDNTKELRYFKDLPDNLVAEQKEFLNTIK